MTSEEWNAILDRMAFCISEMVNPNSAPIDYYDKAGKYREKMKKEGFALLIKYFRNLWW